MPILIAIDISTTNIFNTCALKGYVWFSLHHHPSEKLLPAIRPILHRLKFVCYFLIDIFHSALKYLKYGITSAFAHQGKTRVV